MPKVVPQYRAEARARIAEAATELFHQKGFHRTSMDDIAEVLGVSKGALYLYFPSKVDLLKEIQAQNRRMSREWMAEALEEADPAAGFTARFDEVLEKAFDQRRMALWLEIMGEAVHDRAIRETIRLDHREDVKSLRRFLAALRGRGLLDPQADLEVTTFALIALFQGAVLEIALGQDGARVRRTLARAVRALLPPPGTARSRRAPTRA